ncbi:MAG: VCBS repeat-containing protein [Deltaproteobacteria bacterium]|nr:VCBS repeat-containing protein [Deltaproteobacteria bacterium]
MAPNGSRFGDWLLDTGTNNVELRADVDGDGVAELLVASPWGIGVLKMVGGRLQSIAMVPNGQRAGGWIVDTTSNQFLYAGDVDGDGREEILVTSPWGLGLLKLGPAGLTTLLLAPNGTRFGGWLLNTADNSFPLLADVNGDGRAEIVVTSPWGLGILQTNGAQLTSIVMAPNGTSFGAWTSNTELDAIEVAADFDGDGRQDLVVRNAAGVAVLRYDGGSLRTIATARHGDDLGGWRLDAARHKVGIAGDFDGDRRSELLVTGDAGLALVKVANGALRTALVAPNGTRFGGWLLNTRDNRLNAVADYDGDGRDELMVSSPWGMGILRLAGNTFASLMLAPNGTRFGGWLLDTADNDLEAGLGQSYGVIVWHPDWTGAVNNTTAFLRKRGFTVFATSVTNTGVTELRRLSRTVRASDRVFVYLAGHGATGRGITDTSQATAGSHIIQFGDNAIVSYSDLAAVFERMAATGADVTVFDGSCDGGEAVMSAIGQRYLALATTGIHAPGLTNTPDPSDVMRRAGRPNSFGMWWSREPTASLMTSQAPHRFYQKIFRSDDTEINRWSLFYKPAITMYQAVGSGWDLMVRGSYLLRYVYPDVYDGLTSAEKDQLNVATEPYLASVRADLTARAPMIAKLRAILGDGALVDRAAQVYAAAYPTPWRTMFGDLAWNVDAEPVRKSPLHNEIEPRVYAGRNGFLRMVAEILRTLDVFEASYAKQERILRDLDRELTLRKIARGPLATAAHRKLKPSVTDYLAFNRFDEQMRIRRQRIVDQLDRPAVRITAKLLGDKHKPIPQDRLSPESLALLLRDELKELGLRSPLVTVHASVDELVTRINAIQLSDGILLDRLFYLLTIVEEAISRASAKGAEVGDLVSF